MNLMYCLSCRKKTDSENFTNHVTRNNRSQVRAKCLTCGGRKSAFVVKNRQGGFIGNDSDPVTSAQMREVDLMKRVTRRTDLVANNLGDLRRLRVRYDAWAPKMAKKLINAISDYVDDPDNSDDPELSSADSTVDSLSGVKEINWTMLSQFLKTGLTNVNLLSPKRMLKYIQSVSYLTTPPTVSGF